MALLQSIKNSFTMKKLKITDLKVKSFVTDDVTGGREIIISGPIDQATPQFQCSWIDACPSALGCTFQVDCNQTKPPFCIF